MALANPMQAVCRAIDARRFEAAANVEMLERRGPRYGADVTWRFNLLPSRTSNWEHIRGGKLPIGTPAADESYRPNHSRARTKDARPDISVRCRLDLASGIRPRTASRPSRRHQSALVPSAFESRLHYSERVHQPVH